MEKAKSGDRLQDVADAKTWNSFIDAAQAHKQDDQTGGSAGDTKGKPTIITALNSSSTDCPWGGIVEIIDSTGKMPEFSTPGSGIGKIGVAQNRIPAGRPGPVAIGGVFDLSYSGSVGDIVGPSDGSYDATTSSASGQIQIIESPDGNDISQATWRNGDHGKIGIANEKMTDDYDGTESTIYEAKIKENSGTGGTVECIRPDDKPIGKDEIGVLLGGGRYLVFYPLRESPVLEAKGSGSSFQATHTPSGEDITVSAPPNSDVKSGDKGTLAVEGSDKKFIPHKWNKVKITSTDSDGSYLLDAVTSSDSSVSFAATSDSDEKLDITVSADNSYKSKISSNDTTIDFLSGKIEPGSGIDITELNDGDDESLEIKNLITDLSSLNDVSGVEYTESMVLVAGSGDYYEEKQLSHTSLTDITTGDHHDPYTDDMAQDAVGGSVDTSELDLGLEIDLDATNNELKARIRNIKLDYDSTTGSVAVTTGAYSDWTTVATTGCQ